MVLLPGYVYTFNVLYLTSNKYVDNVLIVVRDLKIETLNFIKEF